MSPKQRFNITIEPEHVEFLRIMERATGASASEHIRRALDAYLRDLKPTLVPEVQKELERQRRQAIKKRLRG